MNAAPTGSSPKPAGSRKGAIHRARHILTDSGVSRVLPVPYGLVLRYSPGGSPRGLQPLATSATACPCHPAAMSSGGPCGGGAGAPAPPPWVWEVKPTAPPGSSTGLSYSGTTRPPSMSRRTPTTLPMIERIDAASPTKTIGSMAGFSGKRVTPSASFL
jgi:hypothetical protein